jgi:thiol-disulfide isomerase/thioredoxin
VPPLETEPSDPKFAFIKVPLPKNDRSDPANPDHPSEKTLTLTKEIEEIDQKLVKGANGAPDELAKLNARRVEILEEMAAENPQNRTVWIKQLADTVGAAVQTGTYPEGVEKLKALYGKLEGKNEDAELAAYVQFRYMTADYSQQLQKEGAPYEKIQAQWLKDLEKYVNDYPKYPDTADAILQLAIAQEFAGDEEKALKWYDRIGQDFGSSAFAAKAQGAKRRLESVGKPMELRGTTIDGKVIDLAKLRDKVVLIQYWASWADTSRSDLPLLKDLYDKYGEKKFVIVGVSLDSDRDQLREAVSTNGLKWPQIFEGGGQDTRLANEMGISTLPTMILVDKKGNVVNRNVHAPELEKELKTLIR